MRKLMSAIIFTAALTATVTLNGYAEGLTSDAGTSATTAPVTTPAPSTIPAATTAPTAAPSVSPAPTAMPGTAPVQQVSITPDHPLYTLKKLIESIKVVVTVSEDKKAQLYVTLANERLAEAEIMSEKNKQELVQSVLKAYVKTVESANCSVEEAVKVGKVVDTVIEDLRIVELNADKIVIKATGTLPTEAAQEIVTAVAEQLQKTLTLQTMQIAKSNLTEAKTEVKQAQEALKAAETKSDAASIKAAEENLAKAEQNKLLMEQQKSDVEAYKKQVMQELNKNDENDDKDDDEDEDKEEGLKERNKKLEKKEEIAKKHLEKEKEKLEKKQDKAKEKYEKAKSRIESKAGKSQQDDGDDD